MASSSFAGSGAISFQIWDDGPARHAGAGVFGARQRAAHACALTLQDLWLSGPNNCKLEAFQ